MSEFHAQFGQRVDLDSLNIWGNRGHSSNIGRIVFNTDYRTSRDLINGWIASASQTYPARFNTPYFDHPNFKRLEEAKASGRDFIAYSLTPEEKNAFWEHYFVHSPQLSAERREFLVRSPGYAYSMVLLKNSLLQVNTYTGTPYTEAENAIIRRFATVFEQSYTRFLDLQKAEASAREAVRSASLDRVRAQTASMRTTTDLERITPLIWKELTTLGVPFIRCGVFIMDEELKQVHTFLSTPDGKAIATLHPPFDFNLHLIAKGVDHWRKKEIYTEHWNASAFTKAWTAFASLAETTVNAPQTEAPPESLYLYLIPFLQGMLYVGDSAPLAQEHIDLLQAVADAFSTAYARYEDFNKLESANIKIEKTLVDLKQTQAQLVQSEKMASLGELTAGIAHEIQNPLNFVNNFSEVSTELVEEMNQEIEKGNMEEAKLISQSLKENLEKITTHGKRAGDIVKGMLQHSRTSSGQKEPTDINALVDEYLRLAYHGLRAKDKSFNAKFDTHFDESIGKVNIIPQDIGRVILNLINNAFYAVSEKSKLKIQGFEPTVEVSSSMNNSKMEIRVKDNGNGIPQKVLDKIFQPFFTTKPTGQGTGLGLSLSYDIVKAHGGMLRVKTAEGKGAEFIIEIPAG